MKKNLLPKTASQRAIAGLTSLALVAGGLTVMPYAGAQDEPAEPVVAAAEPNNDAAAEEAAPAEAAAFEAAAEDAALPEGAAAVALANAPQLILLCQRVQLQGLSMVVPQQVQR